MALAVQGAGAGSGCVCAPDYVVLATGTALGLGASDARFGLARTARLRAAVVGCVPSGRCVLATGTALGLGASDARFGLVARALRAYERQRWRLGPQGGRLLRGSGVTCMCVLATGMALGLGASDARFGLVSRALRAYERQ
jgi:hypothetical protein